MTDVVSSPPDNLSLNNGVEEARSADNPNKEGDNDSGVDETTQGKDTKRSASSPSKSVARDASRKKTDMTSPSKQNRTLTSPSKASKPKFSLVPEKEPVQEKKKIPMNKVQVGSAASPDLKNVRSKIGSVNTTYKPKGGNVKIESKKLQWTAKSKIGSLENKDHKPGGGDKKIENRKLEFKDRAKPKVGSTDNIKHKPGGGEIKIEQHKVEVKASSKVGSLDNVKHQPGGGDKAIFDDKEYIRQMSGGSTRSPRPNSSTDGRLSGTEIMVKS